MNMSTTNNTINATEIECFEQDPYDPVRFGYIMAANVMSMIGIIKNLACVWMFLNLAAVNHRITTARLYVTFLAVADTSLCVMYIMVTGIDAIALYFVVESIFRLYYSYLHMVFYLIRATQLMIPWFIIVATFERWLMLSQLRPLRRLMTHSCMRIIVNLGIVFGSLALKLVKIKMEKMEPQGHKTTPNFAPMLNQYEIYTVPVPDACKHFYDTMTIIPTQYYSREFIQYYDFFGGNMIQIFIPFGVLIALNMFIITKLKQESRTAREEKKISRAANSVGGGSSLQRRVSARKHTTNEERLGIVNGMQRDMENDSCEHPANRQSQNASIELPAMTDIPDGFPGAQPVATNGRESAGGVGRQQPIDHSTSTLAAIQRNIRMRETMFTMMVIVTSYLLCNAPGFVLSVIEQFFGDAIIDNKTMAAKPWYTVFSDIQSILFVFCSFLRLSIYLSCSHELRAQFVKMLCGSGTDGDGTGTMGSGSHRNRGQHENVVNDDAEVMVALNQQQRQFTDSTGHLDSDEQL